MWQEHLKNHAAGLLTGRAPFDPARPSLLMLHGAGGRGDAFLPQLNLISSANVAALELPGHGSTPGPSCPSINEYAAWVAGFIAAGPLRPVVLGHSMGGAIGLSLALLRPELISGLILAGSGAALPVDPEMLSGLEQSFEATVKRIISAAHARGAPQSWIDIGVSVMTSAGPKVVAGDFRACNAFDLSARLGGIKPPTLIIQGDKDRLAPPSHGTALHDGIPGSLLRVIEGAGHMAHLEKAVQFNRLVTDFLAGELAAGPD